MTTSDTLAAAPGKRLKSLTLEVPSFEVGPGGVPIFYGTEESPVTIRGRVVFHTQHECKGSRVLVRFSAIEDLEWRVSSGNIDRVYRNNHEYKVLDFKLKLPQLPVTEHVDPVSGKTIITGVKDRVPPGTYSLDFTIPIDPLFPSSNRTSCGKMVYQLRATLIRPFPSVNVVYKQPLWVLNSRLPPPSIPLEPMIEPLTWRVYGGLDGDIKYRCFLPSYPICLGYPFPLWVRLESVDPQHTNIDPTSFQSLSTSTSASNFEQQAAHNQKKRTTRSGLAAVRPFKVSKGTMELREKTWYVSSGGYYHSTIRKTLKMDVIKEQDHYPHGPSDGDNIIENKDKGENEDTDGVIQIRNNDDGQKGKNSRCWSKMVMVQVPNVWGINPDSRTAIITTQHVLIIKLDVRYGFFNKRTVTFDVPLVLRVPRPPPCPSNRHDIVPSVLGF
ncbi:hypothetical protein EMPS_08018 [Entomortierella parvispora]|uniref:Arrestin-like N-terminal domain-containing protein n=1 Tax=Entomortierella parvispora TaxID=205924 RepID=A0A9P3HF97_9FUNG|nr:hypothetical protein EMPS_08018 [Entomortierella parvispora]